VSDSTYFFAENAMEGERLTVVESVFDPGTIDMLTATGVQSGWRCLVVGAGHGSIARWLAERVTPGGLVVATDIDTQFLASSASPSLEVRRHDLLAEPLEADAYDLAHARKLLSHLVGHQQEAIDRLVGAVRVGGWLAIDDSDALTTGAADPAHPAAAVFTDVMDGAFEVAEETMDLLAGRHVAAMLDRHPDLDVVNTAMTATIERGGSPFGRYVADSTRLVLPALIGVGKVSATSAEVFTDAWSDPSFRFVTELRYQILARKVRS
jgi:SAM-dependent methyltransferase